MKKNKLTIITVVSAFLSWLLVLLSINVNAQVDCNATTVDEFFACYGGRGGFSKLYIDALTAFINAEDAIAMEDYAQAKNILDELWTQYPIGSSIWNTGFSNQKGTNIGSPYGYYGLRMLNDIVNYKLGQPDGSSTTVVAKMKIVLVGCMQGIQPNTQQELDNGTGDFVTRTVDESLLASDYRIIKQSIDLFTKYSEAMTGGDLTVEIDFINLPDVCVEASINAFNNNFGQSFYDARPNLGPVWDAIDDQTFNDTDWWMIITPSAVPIGEDFEDEEFIIGGMGADNKGGPLFIADDAWLVRKPYHLGEGNYSEIERRAYLPQWYQHEFFHHLYRIYPEFSLEVNGHDWFNRNSWPDDFTGLYEPDYYAESLYKRLQVACDPLSNRFISRVTNTDFELFNDIDINDVLGSYSLDNIGNPWHEGEIIASENSFFWRNTAGVQWELNPKLSEGYLETGPDCPYPGNNHNLQLAKNERGERIGINSGFLFNGEFYRRRFKSFFDKIPVEFTYRAYTGASSNKSSQLYYQYGQYLWEVQGESTLQLQPDFDQGLFLTENAEVPPYELIVYNDDFCDRSLVLGLNGEDEVFTLGKVNPDNQSPQIVKLFTNIEFKEVQTQSLDLSVHIEDPESDDLLYFIHYDDQKVSATVTNNILEIVPLGNINSVISVTAIDANRGAVSSSFEVNAENLVLAVDNNKKSAINIYPNPTTGMVRVDGLTEVHEYAIYSLSGSKLKSGTFMRFIDVSGFNSGLYILEIVGSKRRFKLYLD